MHIINYDNCPFPSNKFPKKHMKNTAFYTFNLDATQPIPWKQKKTLLHSHVNMVQLDLEKKGKKLGNCFDFVFNFIMV